MRGDAGSAVVQAAHFQGLDCDRGPAPGIGSAADRAYHDQIAAAFDASYQGPGGFAYTQAFTGILVQLGAIRAGMRVLDLGCGTGRFTRQIALQSGAGVVGVDHSSEMVRLAKRNVGTVARVRQADAGALPFPDQSFDVVLCFGVWHHVVGEGDPKCHGIAGEMARLLRRGGRAIVVEPNAFNPYFAVTTWLWHDLQRRVSGYPRVPHERPLTKGFLRNAMQGAGLQIEHLGTVAPLAAWSGSGAAWARAAEWVFQGPLRALGTHVVAVGVNRGI